jgi:predicted nucleotidyltransferase
MKKGLKSKYRVVVDGLVQAFGGRVKTAVLFGSQARGTTRTSSDHDIFVVIEDLPKDRFHRHRILRDTLLPSLDKIPGSTAFVAKTPQEVEDNLTPLLLEVCVEGICLYGEQYFEPYRKKALHALRQSGLKLERIGGTRMWMFPHLPKDTWELSWEGYREGTR